MESAQADVRVQEINGDVVVEISEPDVKKTRLSQNDILRRKEIAVAGRDKYQAIIDQADEQLTLIEQETIKSNAKN